MRLCLVSAGVVFGVGVASAWGQSPCAGYPAAKTWQADPGAEPGTKMLYDAEGDFPGWEKETSNSEYITHTHPASVGGETAVHVGERSVRASDRRSKPPDTPPPKPVLAKWRESRAATVLIVCPPWGGAVPLILLPYVGDSAAGGERLARHR